MIFPVPSFVVGTGSKRRDTSVIASSKQEPRTLGVWKGEVDGQAQCGFLMKLCAELRNEIYEYVFALTFAAMDEVSKGFGATNGAVPESKAGDATKKVNVGGNDKEEEEKKAQVPSRPAHPLDLLLSCRRVNMEATIIAFRMHPFLVESTLTFHALRQRTLILPAPSLSAITSMAFVLTRRIPTNPAWSVTVSNFLCNAILVSPNIKQLVVRQQTYQAPREAHGPRADFPYDVMESCERHVPSWFTEALSIMQAGRSYVWQKGERWTRSFAYLHSNEDVMFRRPVPSAQLCRGACTALLTQEGSGRKVEVRLVYEWDWEALRGTNRAGLKVVLVPGTEERLPVEMVNGETGLVYDPGEEYWEDLRKRRHLFGMNVNAGEAWRGSLGKFLM